MERLAPAGDTYQAGTLSGNPLATAAGLATLALLDAGRVRAARRARPSGSPPGCARRPPAPASPVQVVARLRPADRVLLRAPGRATTSGARACRRRRLRALLRRDARARRLPAAVAVRGLVPVARAQATTQLERTIAAAAEAFAAWPASDGEPVTDGGRWSELRALIEAEGGEPARSCPGPRAARCSAPLAAARRAREPDAAEYALLVESIFEGYLAALRRAAARRPAETRTCGCSPGDYLYALGLARLAQLGDLEAVRRAGRPDHPLRAGARRGSRRAPPAVEPGRARCGRSARWRSPPGPGRSSEARSGALREGAPTLHRSVLGRRTAGRRARHRA